MADLKTIISITQDALKKQVPTHQAVLTALEALRPREAEVVTRRAGIKTGEPETLAQIGDEFGITRERVRQIENQGIKKFCEEMKKPPLSDILGLAIDLIRDHGGALSADTLSEQFLPESQHTPAARQALDFLMEQSSEVVLEPATKTMTALYAISQTHATAVHTAAGALEKVLAAGRKPATVSALHEAIKADEILAAHAHLITEPLVAATLEAGKRFIAATDDTWGLSDWPEINPRNIREKTLYMLRKVGTPLHFKEITERIEQAKFDRKAVTTQAVHNELINGKEFVLIGRGIYALSEWGYIPGTVADVIRSVLKKAGSPMEREAIVSQVLKQRHVSRNTILINLQEKSRFSRVDKHTYDLAG